MIDNVTELLEKQTGVLVSKVTSCFEAQSFLFHNSLISKTVDIGYSNISGIEAILKNQEEILRALAVMQGQVFPSSSDLVLSCITHASIVAETTKIIG